jgi:malonyl-CoA/methylmalonyl-CoA synthetase
MNLNDLFALSLSGCASQTALEFGNSERTFTQLDHQSNRLAHRLAQDGFRRGDRLAVYLANCVELIEIYLAAVKLGLIFVPINVLYRGREIEHILADSEPRGIVTNSELESYLIPCLQKLNASLLYRAAELQDMSLKCPATAVDCPAEGDSPAALVYTSGTTGRSKGAILTHNNFAANAVNLIVCWRMTSADRLLLALPLFHVHGLGNGLHTWLACGYRIRLLDRFRKETIVEEFLRFRPTAFFGVPTMYERLLDTPPKTAREIGGFMRLFVSGSAPLPAQTLERFAGLFGHAILERYGMSETLMNISNPYAEERRAGTVGKPLPGVSVRLVDPETGKDAPAGTVGEVLIKGPNVFPGYWRQPEATAAAFTDDGYFRSGDMAVRSADGYYTLQGRRHELIISGGFNIYPREIEEFLMEQPGVAEAAVIGEPDAARGQIPIAYVVPSAGETIDEQALAACCKQHLASFKAPRRFVVAESLPRNALGKVQKHRLRE